MIKNGSIPPWSTLPAAFFSRRLKRAVGILTVLLWSAQPLPAIADDADGAGLLDLSLRELMSVEVFQAASLIPTEHRRAPGTSYSFNRNDFKRLGVRSLEELIRFVPGIQTNQYRKRHDSIWARGIIDRYNDKMVLMVDGIPSRHLYYNHFSLGENLPLENIEKVEIIIGPASSLYGANAFGGVISVTTRELPDDPESEITAEAADNHRAKGTVRYATDSFSLFAGHLRQDAPYPEDRKSFIGGNTVQPLGETYTNLYLKARPAEGLTLIADYRKTDMPFLFIPDTQDAYIHRQPLTLAAKYDHGTINTGRVEAKLYYTRDDVKEHETENDSRTTAMEEYQNGTMAGASLTGFWQTGKHTFTLGGNWQRESAGRMENIRYWHYARKFLSPAESTPLLSRPNAENDDYAVFLQYVYAHSENLTLTLGGRYDQYEAFNGYANYRLALVYSLSEAQTLKLLYGTATRTPSFREYLKVLENTSFKPPTARPESMRTLELGYHHQWEEASLYVTLFHNTFEDYIRETPTPDGNDEYFANSSEIWRMDGAEALVQWQPTADLSARLTGAYLNATRSGQGALPYLAHFTGSFNLDYTYRSGHAAGVSLIHNGQREDTNNYPDDNPAAFTIVNVHFTGDISRSLSYRLGVENLTDLRINDPAGDFGGQYNTMREIRQFWLELTWRPGL